VSIGEGFAGSVSSSPAASGPAFLMCPPTMYDVNYVINPWMEGNLKRSSQHDATRQWDQLFKELSRLARVELVEQQAGSPDMVFTANAGLVCEGTVALSRFLHPERQGEEPHFRKWFDDSGFKVRELPRAVPFEGEGDALFEADNSRLWAGHGMRSRESSHRYLQDAWGVEVISLRLIDPRFYHLDTCFCPLFGGFLVYYPEAFDAQSKSAIGSRYPAEKRIAVSLQDAVRFACNAINIGKTILLNEVSEQLSSRLETLGFRVIQIELTEFLKAGGAAKCLVLRLSEMEATHGFATTNQRAMA
jgi:N-dimethylarginine dimethylaminohydrolase